MSASDKPLQEKLGIREGMVVGLLNAPNFFELDLGELPDDVKVLTDSNAGNADLFLIFADRSDEAQRAFERATAYLPADGAIWVAWPKKSSDRDSDLDENTLRDLFLPSGMVDNKVCSIDETWSAVRFVVRKENRGNWPRLRA